MPPVAISAFRAASRRRRLSAAFGRVRVRLCDNSMDPVWTQYGPSMDPGRVRVRLCDKDERRGTRARRRRFPYKLYLDPAPNRENGQETSQA